MVVTPTSNYYPYLRYYDYLCSDISRIIVRLHAFLTVSRFSRLLVLVAIAISVTVITFLVCLYISEKYFFDKFYYNKSVKYGYPSKNWLSEYNLRAKDLISLHENPNELFNNQKESYNIVIFGDSYVYGQGIKNSDRFANILNKKLNQVRKTRVLAFSETSRSPIDYLNWYHEIPSNSKINLFIFALVNNDAFIRTDKYGKFRDKTGSVNLCQRKYPSLTPVPDIALNNFLDQHKIRNINEVASTAYEQSWTNSINLCILKNSLYNLPVEKSIYFITDDYLNNNDKYKLYRDMLSDTNKYVISSSRGKDINKYRQYWNPDPWKSFKVSNSEEHPNSLANQMYADILYNEIISNPKYRFKNDI